jgi:hypothetical protein
MWIVWTRTGWRPWTGWKRELIGGESGADLLMRSVFGSWVSQISEN